MPNYSLMGDTISNAAGTGAPSFPFGLLQPFIIKDIANAPYVITNSDGVGIVTSTVTLTSNQSVTLPSATANLSRQIQFKKMDSSTFAIQISVTGGDTLDGLTSTFSLSGAMGSVTVCAIANGKWVITQATKIAPTITKITAASSIYNTPVGCTYLSIEMVGAGGGGGAGATGGSATSNATAGTSSQWKIRSGAAIVVCGGGGLGGAGGNNYSDLGGTVSTFTAPAINIMSVTGMRGGTAPNVPSGSYSMGALGGVTFWGGGSGPMGNTPAMVPSANTGNGGSGGGTVSSGGNQGGGGGSAGAFCKFLLYNPSAQYDVIIGTGGLGGTGTVGGAQPGANGSDGGAVVTEYYN